MERHENECMICHFDFKTRDAAEEAHRPGKAEAFGKRHHDYMAPGTGRPPYVQLADGTEIPLAQEGE